MKRTYILAVFFFLGISAGVIFWYPTNSAPTQALSLDKQIVIKLAPGVGIGPIVSQFGLTLVDQLVSKNEYLLQVPLLGNVNAILPIIRILPGVEDAGPNVLMWTHRGPHGFPGGDPTVIGSDSSSYKSQQLTAFLQVDSLHLYSQGQGVKVAVVDTGIDRSQPAFAGHSVLTGYDYVDHDAYPNDEPGGSNYGHGTFISGLIFLVAPQSQVVPVRVLTPDGLGDSFHVAAGIYYASDQGVQVINLSLGTDQNSGVIKRAVTYAQNKGCLVVAAVGNDNLNANDIYPASYPNVVGVAATDFNDQKAAFSNYGPTVDLDAPGVNLISAFPQGNYAYWSGTSFAAPLVSAESALLFAKGKNGNDVVNTMRSSAIKLNQTTYQLGVGRISPFAALAPRQ